MSINSESDVANKTMSSSEPDEVNNITDRDMFEEEGDMQAG